RVPPHGPESLAARTARRRPCLVWSLAAAAPRARAPALGGAARARHLHRLPRLADLGSVDGSRLRLAPAAGGSGGTARPAAARAGGRLAPPVRALFFARAACPARGVERRDGTERHARARRRALARVAALRAAAAAAGDGGAGPAGARP